MSVNNELTLRSIGDLLDKEESFYIPAYQRGYRWARRQVLELLEDVLEFTNKRNKSEGEFYCLQPVVIRDKDGQWELIDGQQRLTTMLLILRYFNQRLAPDFRKKLYSMEYETRPASMDYLESIDEERKDVNIDFHHIYEAFSEIQEWFADKVNRINDIESAFLNDVKIIWYEVREDINPIDVFARLNIGKIPLTNAELVKALFLRSRNFSGEDALHQRQHQLQIAQEWDEIEKQLQDSEFWFFLQNETKESNRIEFILKLIADDLASGEIDEFDDFYIFHAFNRHFVNDEFKADEEWSVVKHYFMTLREWYRSRTLYHLVGFLIAQNLNVEEIRGISDSCDSKQAFLNALKWRVFELVFPALDSEILSDEGPLREAISEALGELSYQIDSHRSKIKAALLLFNMAALLQNGTSTVRFEFDRFKEEAWDIEHIRSVASDMPESTPRQKKWLDGVVEYYTGSADREAQEKFIEAAPDQDEEKSLAVEALAILEAKSFDDEEFTSLYERITSYYDPNPDDEADHSIGNLSLLDSHTNRSYQNSVFPIKRRRIISLDKEGIFVPLCTKNAFLKYYSQKIDKMMFWDSVDSECHERAMVDALVTFFSNKGSTM